MEYLPFVTNEVGCSVAASFNVDMKPDREIIREELSRLKKKNPAVAEFIMKWAKLGGSKRVRDHSLFCGILTYKLLESQAEANWMNENLPV